MHLKSRINITFYRFPATRLGKLMRASSVEKILELCEEFVPGDVPEFFFDKHPENFPAILDMYRTSTFHTTESGCALGNVLRRFLKHKYKLKVSESQTNKIIYLQSTDLNLG